MRSPEPVAGTVRWAAAFANEKLNLDSLTRAAGIIRAGGVVAYPTESCFGLGCDPRNGDAVRRILRIKHRSRAKGLILIADRQSRLLPFVDSFAVECRAQIIASWPGRHTWLLPAKRASKQLRGGHPTLAVRVTAHPDAARLCQLARTAIVSTSANRAGRPALRSAAAVRHAFCVGASGEVDFVVDGRIGGDASPSVIRHGETGQVVRG